MNQRTSNKMYADFYILRTAEQGGVLQKIELLVCSQTTGKAEMTGEHSKANIIAMIEIQGCVFATAIMQKEPRRLLPGSRVYPIQGAYIRTTADGIKEDNLGELPPIDPGQSLQSYVGCDCPKLDLYK